MREYAIGPLDAGRRMDKWLAREAPLLGVPLTRKYLRLKRIKLNGKGAKGETVLTAGDRVQLYINDELLEKPPKEDKLLKSFTPHLRVLYEDENVLLVDKKPGLIVHPDEGEKVDTLLTHIRAYLYQKGERGDFAPVLCNRIDRFTSGIVIAAKNEAAMHVMNEKIRLREVEKHYLCAVRGVLDPPDGLLSGYIGRPEGRGRMRVQAHPAPGYQDAATRYGTLATQGELSLVACELLTGRTHQIRAQMAAAGHPLLGDGQYGDPAWNRRYGREYQALCACRVVFAFQAEAGVLENLRGKSVSAAPPPFVREYFSKWEGAL